MRRIATILPLLLASAACTTTPGNPVAVERMVAPILTGPDARDVHSYARPEIARVTHVALDLDADFEARRMAGTATLDIQAAAAAREIVLDSKGLEIQSITGANGRPLPFTLGARGRRAAMADPGADRGRAPPLPVQPGPGDPQPKLDPDPGQPRHPPDLGSQDHRAGAAHRRHVGRAADPRG